MVTARNLPNEHPQNIPWTTYEAVRKQLQAANQKIRQLEQELKQEKDTKWQERNLWKRKDFKPAMKAEIIEVQRQIERAEVKDSEGYVRVCHDTAARHIGMDQSASPRLIDNIKEQCPTLPWETKTVKEETPNGVTPRLYVKAKENLIQAAATIEISEEKIRKQGGNQYACQGRLPSGETCGSKNVTIERELLCHDCGHRSKLDPTYPNGDIKKKKSKTSRNNLFSSSESEPVAKNFDESAQVVDVVLKPDTPPIVSQVEPLAGDESRDAQFLYLSIAGVDPTHIEMLEDAQKYGSRSRLLTQDDIAAHIDGRRTFGARCWYPGNVTRAFCKDADNEADLKRLEEGARKLAAAGFKPMIEYPPDGRPSAEGWHEDSAHSWIVSTENTNAANGWQEIYRIAPEWQELEERWPLLTNEARGNRVRLPGGKYVMPGYRDWCYLVDVETGDSATNGVEMARMLLTHQTPASLFTPKNPGPGPGDHRPVERDPVQASDEIDASPVEQEPIGLADLDAEWLRKYGDQKLWFRFLPSYLIARFNEQHSPIDFLPKQKNGKAFSPNGEDWDPSTALWTDDDGRERYTDFSNNGHRPDGRQDTGDAFDAYLKTNSKTMDQALYELGKATNARAKSDLESAARQGHAIPGWIEEIISDHGREYYARLRGKQQPMEQEALGGVSGFQDVGEAPTDEGWPNRCPECGDMHFTSHEADALYYELVNNRVFNLRSGTFYCAEYLSLPDFYSIIQNDLSDQAASSYQIAIEALQQKLAEVRNA